MNDFEKIARLEMALRLEEQLLRKAKGPANIRASSGIGEYLATADLASKLRFANILMGESTEDASPLRAVR